MQTPVRLIVSSAADTPIVSVLAAAPDRATATRLAAAAAPALRFIIASAPDTVRKRLKVEALSAPEDRYGRLRRPASGDRRASSR